MNSKPPTLEQVMSAVYVWSCVIPFFPADVTVHKYIATDIMRYCGKSEQFQWLSDQVPRVFKAWSEKECNIPNLRGLFCTRFVPRDGQYAPCSVSGYTPEEIEGAALLAEARANDEKLDEYRRQALLAPPDEREAAADIKGLLAGVAENKKL